MIIQYELIYRDATGVFIPLSIEYIPSRSRALDLMRTMNRYANSLNRPMRYYLRRAYLAAGQLIKL